MTTAALAAMLAMAAPAAFAADSATGAAAPPAVHEGVTATQIQPGQILATAMQGADIYDSQNKSIATVADIILDRDGRVAAVVANVDGKKVGIAMKDLDITTNPSNQPHLSADISKDQLKSAQAFDLGDKTDVSGSSVPPATTPPTRKN
jgi:sporulation protein YlmC with PRC-barrel domain